MGATLATEKLTNTVDTEKMLNTPQEKLGTLSKRLFVLWDVHAKRGWLVNGDVVALHLLRIRLEYLPESELDFYTLNHVGNGSSSAYEVLNDWKNRGRVLWRQYKEVEEKSENSEDGQPVKDHEKITKTILGEFMDGIYSTLIQMSDSTVLLNGHGGLSGRVQDWYEKRWGTTLRGWDFDDIVQGEVPQVYVRKLKNDPGWLRMTRAANATFLFTDGLGEIVEPRDDSCCPYFQTLPTGQNFLASNMDVLLNIVRKWGGTTDKEDTVARLNPDDGWECRLHPFERPNCQGKHFDTLDPSCFPVQGLRKAPLDVDHLKKDTKILKGKKVYSNKDIYKMAAKLTGVEITDEDSQQEKVRKWKIWKEKLQKCIVVFGPQPTGMELKKLAKPIQDRKSPSAVSKATKAPAAPKSSSGSASHGATPGSACPTASASSGATAPGPTSQKQSIHSNNGDGGTSSKSSATVTSTVAQQSPAVSTPRAPSVRSVKSTASASKATGGGNKEKDSGQQSMASVPRAPSISSVRSLDSTTRSKASSAGAGAEQSQASACHPSTASAHRSTSNASLRSNNSIPRPKDTSAGSSRSQTSNTQSTAPTVERNPSTSSVRTQTHGSVSSKTTGGSRSQTQARQPAAAGLNRTTTNSSDKTTSSHSTSTTQRSATETAAAKNRQQQQQQQSQLGTATAAGLAPDRPVSSNHAISSAGTTERPRPTSSDVPSS